MLKKSLFSELIKKFTDALLKIDELKINGNYDEALTVIDDICKDIFRLSIKFLNKVTDENILEMLRTEQLLFSDKCIIISKLFEEQAEIYELMHMENESFYIYVKALSMYMEAYSFKKNAELVEYLDEIDVIAKKVLEFKLPSPLLWKLVDYYKSQESFDSAENLLYEVLEQNNYENNQVALGIQFYEELLQKSSSELEEGNLPLDEVKESLENLKNRNKQ